MSNEYLKISGLLFDLLMSAYYFEQSRVYFTNIFRQEVTDISLDMFINAQNGNTIFLTYIT